MKAVLFYGPQDIRYENTMIKPLDKGEILVKIEAALTCGTDVKTFRRGHPVLIKDIPSGFGHEFAGIVEKVSEDVDNVKVGDRVVYGRNAGIDVKFDGEELLLMSESEVLVVLE